MIAGLSGCAPAVQAPDNIESMVVFGFAEFAQAERLASVVDPLHAWAGNHLEELDAGYGVDALTSGDLALAGVPGVSIDGILGALGRADYASDVDAVAAGVSHPHKEQVLQGTLSFDVRWESGERACFLAHECDSYDFEAFEEASVPVMGVSRRTIQTHLRWVTGDHGVEVLAMRQVVPEATSFDVALMEIDQQYGFTLVHPHEGGARRLEAFWVDARVLGLELPEGYAVQQAVQRMQASAAELDAWAASED